MNRKPWDARIASFIVTPFVNSRFVHPNHLTGLRLLVGLAGAACFARGESPNLAALLIVVSNFLDHTDGELARLSGKTSRFGHYFDLASDALVTVGMFVGIGIGLTQGSLGTQAAIMGAVAGVTVAAIFHLRNDLENHLGKTATRQPQWAGFEAEDVLYLMPAVTLSGSLEWFLYAAAVGAPVACAIVAVQYFRAMQSRSRPSR
ncbi:MAG: CDP-alcohol phosphatidyltransferase family protein [Gammaproteobacteria bacterium]|nr:CDP-alcohol phosphatidyltransferase family protein [Gammaproteobacteria bacterium]